MAPRTVIGFDLYGTLLSTESIARELAGLYGDETAKSLAAQWRRYQLEYTWRANSMGIYRPFSEMTRAALRHAVTERKLPLSDADASRFMDAYDGLDTFPEIEAAMDMLSREPSLDAYVFSNGTNHMVSSSVETSPVLSRARHFLGEDRLITVEPVGAFKPDPRTYRHLADKTGVGLDQIWVVSANPFDALGATAAGARSVWIDRAGTGWVDALGGLVGAEPTVVATGVDEAIREILARTDMHSGPEVSDL